MNSFAAKLTNVIQRSDRARADSEAESELILTRNLQREAQHLIDKALPRLESFLLQGAEKSDGLACLLRLEGHDSDRTDKALVTVKCKTTPIGQWPQRGVLGDSATRRVQGSCLNKGGWEGRVQVVNAVMQALQAQCETLGVKTHFNHIPDPDTRPRGTLIQEFVAKDGKTSAIRRELWAHLRASNTGR